MDSGASVRIVLFIAVLGVFFLLGYALSLVDTVSNLLTLALNRAGIEEERIAGDPYGVVVSTVEVVLLVVAVLFIIHIATSIRRERRALFP